MFRFAALFFLLSASAQPAFATGGEPLSLTQRVELQVAMQSYIESNSVKGALLHLDPQSGEIRAYYPTKAHRDMTMIGDTYYYLCSNFVDDQGKTKMVNFYLAREAERYVVIHADFTGSEELEEKVTEFVEAQPKGVVE